jgi:hypothetical protein
MIVSGIFHKMKEEGLSIDNICSEVNIQHFLEQTSSILSESHLENPEYKASSTNPIELKKVIDLYIVNK